MGKYIDADLLRNEIEKRMHICDGVFERDSDTYYQGKAVAYRETLSFIDSLQKEEPDLEKEIDAFLASGKATKEVDSGGFITTYIDPRKVVRHFYELGLNARKEE